MSDNAVLATTEGQLLSADSTTDNSYMPCIELRRFVQTLLSEKVCGNKLEAERVSGVNRGRFYKAMYYEPRFRAWFSEQCDLFLAGSEPVASGSLMNKIRRGDTLAIRTYYELRKKLGTGVVPVVGNQQTTRILIIQQLHSLASKNGHENPSSQPAGSLVVVDEMAGDAA